MPSIYDIKPAFQNLLRPITNSLARIGITPNQVTTAAAVLSIAVGLAIYRWHENRLVLLALPIFLFIRMALNAIDGMLAREHDMKSDLGAFLNELGDVISDTALYLPFAAIPHFNPILVIVLVLLAALTEMTGVVAVQIKASRRYEGPMGKSDRAFVFGIIGLVLAVGVPTGAWCSIILWIILAALILTICNRIRKALQEVK
ncbi:Inner membrane protein YnbA [Anaerohalosphaera lusitana]|uniref:Inner membrane protein YnbA n=1 Tax=Anaerohalosphaera lusitana TaxID=1936003 RepID=A0A1U9NJR0_9BACT|nr:CDP-alcohol phosphatidyltransferase family protein [Anaerohalosphaera lusitana]AQT68047.1 Inner membrane protein YnbA [Anaerohalosphaera lusitana]